MKELLTIVLGTSTTLLAFFAWRFFNEARNLRSRYSGMIDIESELAIVEAKLDQTRRNRHQFEGEDAERRAKLSQEYEQALVVYTALKTETSVLEESLEDMSFGLYKPHFEFQTADEYKTALQNLREKQRQIIRSGEAVVCRTQWTVDNSKREGARMIRQESKLMLRAFNGECEAALSDVAWNNITKMEERVRKSFEAVNNLGEVSQISVTPGYLQLRLDEIRLKHDYEEKRYREREEQREIREQMREEEKARREIEKAREEAEAEEARYQKALERARAEAAKATGAQLQKLSEQISSIESKLDQGTEGQGASDFESGTDQVRFRVRDFECRLVRRARLQNRYDPPDGADGSHLRAERRVCPVSIRSSCDVVFGQCT
jgi:hypothetical protein